MSFKSFFVAYNGLQSDIWGTPFPAQDFEVDEWGSSGSGPQRRPTGVCRDSRTAWGTAGPTAMQNAMILGVWFESFKQELFRSWGFNYALFFNHTWDDWSR
jgi:hypothetical protein